MKNKIEIENDIVKKIHLDSSIEYSFMEKNILFDVNQIKLRIKKNTELIIIQQATDDTKLDLILDVLENVSVKITELLTGSKSKLQYKYLLDKNSTLDIQKFYDKEITKQLDMIYLNGESAQINYTLKTIATDKEKYDITVYHNASNTKSNLKIHGVAIKDGKIIFNVTGIVKENMKNCSVNQENRIINLTENQCLIDPNLFIDEYEVEANHSAHIGGFSAEELFYLQSRGIPKEQAEELLIKGFLHQGFETESVKEYIDDIINHYWR